MIELLLLLIASVLYWVAKKYFSKEERGFTCFGTKGTIIVIVASIIFFLSTILGINNIYLNYVQ